MASIVSAHHEFPGKDVFAIDRLKEFDHKALPLIMILYIYYGSPACSAEHGSPPSQCLCAIPRFHHQIRLPLPAGVIPEVLPYMVKH